MKNWILYLFLFFIVGGFWQCNVVGVGNEFIDSVECLFVENGNFIF